MDLVKIEDLEEIENLKGQCIFIDDARDTDVYALLDNGDAKTVFTLKRIGDHTQPISTIRQLDFQTKKEAQGQGYATIGVQEMIKVIEQRKDISEVYVDAANPISGKIAEKLGIESADFGRYVIRNPNFDINYETVCQMIKNGVPEEQVRAFGVENGMSQKQIDTWLSIQSTLPQKEFQTYEVPIFTPPAENVLEDVDMPQPFGNDGRMVNGFGENDPKPSRLVELAGQKGKCLEALKRLKEIEAELESKKDCISPNKGRDSI